MTQRTIKQNNSIHLSFRQFADDLNDAGWSITKALEMDKIIHLEIPWQEQNIKEVFREIMRYRYPDKEWKDPKRPSTPELKTTELMECWEILNKAMGERFNVTRPFPSEEEQFNESQGRK